MISFSPAASVCSTPVIWQAFKKLAKILKLDSVEGLVNGDEDVQKAAKKVLGYHGEGVGGRGVDKRELLGCEQRRLILSQNQAAVCITSIERIASLPWLHVCSCARQAALLQ